LDCVLPCSETGQICNRAKFPFDSHIFSLLTRELEAVYINVTYVIYKQVCFILKDIIQHFICFFSSSASIEKFNLTVMVNHE
jgi:hypothetical protein